MRISTDSWLANKPIAHRGLWGNGVIENSMTAYRLASEKNIPIEIDLYLTKDKKLVSFHDTTLVRMTGQDGKIWDYTLDELKNFRLSGSDETIPTFEEVLSVAKGKSPLLIELKQQPIEGMVDEVLKALDGYDGEFAIQSFDPRYIIELKKKAPHIIRGVLSTSNPGKISFIKKLIVSKMALNFLAKPDFISVDHKDYPIKRKYKKKFKLAWTLTSNEDYQKVKPFVNNVIYEGFEI